MRRVLCVAAFLLAPVLALAQEKKDHAEGTEKPGPAHQQLARRSGGYVTVTRVRMQPDASAVETRGDAKITSVLDGRFLLEENSGTLFGQPFKGVRLFGYNNDTRQYEACWTYTQSTAILKLIGSSADDGKSLSLSGVFDGPKGEKIPVNARIRHLDDNRFVVELLGKATDGSEFTVVETTYTRKK